MSNPLTVQKFFREYFVGQQGLNVTIKSSGGASVNIDGPFEIKEFEWKEFNERHTVLWRNHAKDQTKRMCTCTCRGTGFRWVESNTSRLARS